MEEILMRYQMKLFSEPFDTIVQGRKTIEVRCYDEKRKQLKPGDEIQFLKLPDQKESITVKVTELYLCNTFQELYQKFNPVEFGCEGQTLKQMLKEIREIYTEEQEKQGVLGIRIQPL